MKEIAETRKIIKELDNVIEEPTVSDVHGTSEAPTFSLNDVLKKYLGDNTLFSEVPSTSSEPKSAGKKETRSLQDLFD